jgi:hypothetical protein
MVPLQLLVRRMNVLLAQRENQSHLHKRAFCHFTFA